ncbi:MAG: NAD(P)H-dependent oxidoreductase [Pseudomonadota bacterium]
MTAKLLFFAGSARKDSVNKKLVKTASDIAQSMGATVTYVDLADYDMPIFSEDIESENGLPENAKKLKQLFIEHDGFCIACPDYNSSFSPLLKNTLDWVSRREEADSGSLVAYKDKTCALMAASPGGLGGLRGLRDTRDMLSSIGVFVIPNQLAVGGAYGKFDEAGNVTDDSEKEKITAVVEALVKTTNALKN